MPPPYSSGCSSADDSDLGYVLGDQKVHPQSNQAIPVVRLNNDKFGVLLPNGIGSGSGTASLFILFVDGPTSAGAWTAGTHYVKIPTDSLTSNGMMGVHWADTNNDGKADIVYGTDLKGRLWKFDISSTNTSNWRSAFPTTGTPIPLFEAKDGATRLPITTAPTLSFPPFGGINIAIGTGLAISTGDFPDSSKTQRFLSIYDRLTWGARSLPSSDLSTFVSRTMYRTSTDDVYVSAGNTAFASATHDGWYFNFPALTNGSTVNNEMVLSSPEVKAGVLFLNSVRPSTSSTNTCYAGPVPAQWGVDPVSGTPLTSLLGTVDVVVGGVTVRVNKAATAVSDQKVTIPIVQKGSKGSFKITGQNTDIDLPEFLRHMRRQWREIPGMRTDQ